ncbi:MAG TPA: GSCFA domain-containing protein [Brevundimonas sp.]|uniref:GSCFA domain-containing protein n=1 Tax=Brevundimonas sp. TaxID=1871086 RepID=UPI002626CC0F|nr:GSCFA domain-containing protein [Brevundimonas sp.]HRO32460.1 GSCFA domain-containing protein [Brevundimonas sp.]
MIDNPYSGAPDHAFWSRAVANLAPDDIRPAVQPGFAIAPTDRVATAGSCFAQHISRALTARGYDYLVTETGPEVQGYGVFPARFGNIYCARQLLQLFQRAYGLFAPYEGAWRTRDGRVVDPFRPRAHPGGFADAAQMQDDRATHLAAVRRMFETMDVFVFTLGLTEGWVSARDGAVFPLAPGVAGGPDDADHIRPHNFTVQQTVDDLTALIDMARALRPDLRVLLTVSPVPLKATFEDRHVLVSTGYSKAVLRAAAGMVCDALDRVDYFPSYEIVTGLQAGSGLWAADLRTVTPTGVNRVMAELARAYLDQADTPARTAAPAASAPRPPADDQHAALAQVICDEEAIEP